VPVIALIDGEHHPAAVRDALDALERERGLAGVVFCGGEEKVRAEVREDPPAHYGRTVALDADPAEALRAAVGAGSADAVVSLADEPAAPPAARLRLAALALHAGLSYEEPGLRLEAPQREPVAELADACRVAVVATSKRAGKTAVAGHLATVVREAGRQVVVVAMGRGGPPEPRLAPAEPSVADLLAIARGGGHAASDHLEAAVLAGVPAVGARRVGGGLAGAPAVSTVADAARLAATLDPDVVVFDGSGSAIPPVEVDATVCVVRDREATLGHLGTYRVLGAELALVLDPGLRRGDEARELDAFEREVRALCPGRTIRFELRPEPAEPIPDGARVALFSTGQGRPPDLEPVLASSALARRADLEPALERAAAERCDVYLTELKAAAIDTVAERAEAEGARVVFLRNRPVGLTGDLDAALAELARG
jgi:cyclic 2,3-diphosphoglycerate synthase